MLTSLPRAVFSLLLSAVMLACTAAQQDNQDTTAADTSSAPPALAQPAAPHAAVPHAAGPLAIAPPVQPAPLPLRFAGPGMQVQPPQVLVVPAPVGTPSPFAAPFQVVPRQGPALRAPGLGGPRLGVSVTETPDGLLITSVEDDSLARSAGVKEKDILLRLGDERVQSVGDVQRSLMAFKPGEQVKVAVIRAGEGIVELQGTLPEPKTPPVPSEPPAADGFEGGFLGVEMARAEDGDGANDAPGADASQPAEPGVGVAGVVPDSAAWFIGLEAGDRLLSIDGKALDGAEELVGAVSSKEPGSLVELRYSRGGTEHTTQVRLGHRRPPSPFGGMALPPLSGAPGLPALPGMRLRFGDPDGASGTPGSGEVFRLLLDPQNFLGDVLQGADVNDLGGDAQSVKVELHDGQGTMIITRDGKTETYALDGDGNWVPQAGAAPQSGDA